MNEKIFCEDCFYFDEYDDIDDKEIHSGVFCDGECENNKVNNINSKKMFPNIINKNNDCKGFKNANK